MKNKMKMKLRECAWGEACVWQSESAEWKKYRRGDKKAIFKIKGTERYSCEGCVRQLIADHQHFPNLVKDIMPLTKRAGKILVLLKL